MEAPPSALRLKLEELFGIDLRSLALFRIGLGLIILADLIQRSFDLRAFYTSSGVLPRSVLLTKPIGPWKFPLHLLNDSVAFQVTLFVLAGLSALALALGYRTRLANFVCWLLMVSLHARNPLVNQAGDILLDLFLFWGLFLPLGACFSLDQSRDSSGRESPLRVISGGSIGLLLQICIVYVFAAVNKTGDLWREGTALYYVFNLEPIVRPAGVFLLGYPRALKFLTCYTMWLERLGPALAFMPVATGFFRTFVVFLFVVFHLGMILTLKLGPFPYISILGWAVFLPSGFWDKFLNSTSRLGAAWATKGVRTGRTSFLWVTHALAVLAILYILLLNLGTSNVDKFRPVFIQKYTWIGKYLGLDQAWAMFAPDPSMDTGWYVIPGKLTNGSEVDIYGGGAPLLWEKPDQVSETTSNVRWRKYLNSITQQKNVGYRPFYARYLCREWNARHSGGEKLLSLEIYYVHQRTLSDYQKTEPQKDLLWEQNCLASSTLESIP